MNISKTFFALIISIMIWGCEEESNLQPEGEWVLSKPALIQFNDSNKLVLDESDPLSEIKFSWDEAVSSASYGVYYEVAIDSVDAIDADNPILSFNADNGGISTSAIITTLEMNEALYVAGYKADEELELQWSVTASCLSKTSSDNAEVTMVRYDDDNLYLSGSATEVGDNVSCAILMNRLVDATGEKLNLYESYTRLTASESFMVYNGSSECAIAYGVDSEDNLVRDGAAITVDEEGIYRINIDFDAMTISYFKIDRMALIGDALENSWNSDEALEYQGLGVWQADISFINAGSYIIRANNDWQGIIKQVSGTDNEVVREDFGNEYGYSFDNFQQSEAGYYTVTLTLTGDEYTIELEQAPEERMYMIVNGTDAYEMTMIGDGEFTTTNYLALQTTDNILINTESDGSGTCYSVSLVMESGDGDKVEGTLSLSENDTSFSPAVDQAYGFTVDITNGELSWHYYNLKLFHWDNDADGGWDAKTETTLTYSHPYTFTATADLQVGYESKFFSPWDIQLGAGDNDDSSALIGTVTNDSGAANLSNISTEGTYNVSLIITADYSTASYMFVAQ